MAHAITDGTIATTMGPSLKGLSIEALKLWSMRALLARDNTRRHSSNSTLHSSQMDSQHDSTKPDWTDTVTEDDGDGESEESSGSENVNREEHELRTSVGIEGSYALYDHYWHYQYNSSDTETYTQQSSDSGTGTTDKDSDAEAEYDALEVVRIQQDNRTLLETTYILWRAIYRRKTQMYTVTVTEQHDRGVRKTTAAVANSLPLQVKTDHGADMVPELRFPGG